MLLWFDTVANNLTRRRFGVIAARNVVTGSIVKASVYSNSPPAPSSVVLSLGRDNCWQHDKRRGKQ
jgi:hypothetical protein